MQLGTVLRPEAAWRLTEELRPRELCVGANPIVGGRKADGEALRVAVVIPHDAGLYFGLGAPFVSSPR